MKIFAQTIIAVLTLTIVQRAFASCTLPIPTDLKLTNQTSCSVNAGWKKVNDASYYIVEYKATGDTNWLFSSSVTNLSVVISGLAANTSYDFAVASFCSDSTTIGYSSSLSKITKKCSAPIGVSSSSVTTNSAVISWGAICGISSFILNYRIQGVTTWSKVSNINADSVTLSNLQVNTTYEYRVQSNCGAYKSSWSAIRTFQTLNPDLPKKNILLIVLDDARYDAFIPTGAPSWFNTPAINRIANEGVNFKVTIPTTSQCAPSRACIYTGVYPHINGVTKNGDTLDPTFPLIQQILKDHGYYTGFVGKYGQFLGKPEGFNWWATSSGDIYVDPPYSINGHDTTITGHISDVYPQLAKRFINSVPAEQNFVLFYFTRVPHDPTIPRTEDAQLYLDDTLPFPSDFPFYTNNYPSFYDNQEWDTDTAGVKALQLATYQTIKGADDNVDSLLKWIVERDSTLDSTLVIFTSDNGFLMGEHHLHNKVLGLEESIRIPLFMRYPDWFGENTVITDEIASNVDIATTLLDFTGIENTYGFQGLSLHQLANGETPRRNFLYETGWDPSAAKIRAVRTLNDMFIRSYCKTTTEEFYDLLTDPHNDTNQIFNSNYADIISQRRLLLDSLRSMYNDITPTKKSCNLVTNGQRIEVYNNEETPELEMIIGPNPATESFTFYFTSHQKAPATISVCDVLGHLLWQNEYSLPLDVFEEIDCSRWAPGIYFVKAEQDGKVYGRKILVQQ